VNSIANCGYKGSEESRFVHGNDLMVFTSIYQDDCNIAVWERDLSTQLQQDVEEYLSANTGLQASMVVSPDNAASAIHKTLGGSKLTAALSENIAELVDIFCCLFELERVGLRLTALDGAMCPRFHVDRVPTRLVTTFQGIATEWLPHDVVDRSKLGLGNGGKSDEESGIFSTKEDIKQLSSGDVALLKGEGWEGNEGAGLVHRSPSLASGGKRLLLTLDFN
jgi:hypothetical protein